MPHPFNIIVKGDTQAALDAAARRKIHVHYLGHLADKYRQALLVVSADECDLASWLSEPPHSHPFPDGSLLFYCPRTDLSTFCKMDVPR